MRSTDQRRLAQQAGLAAELHVAELLEAQGWSVLEHSWRCRAGEIDLIVVRDGALRFVEVKARARGDVLGLEAVGAAKQRRLGRAADAFLDLYQSPFTEAAFMVALVSFDDGRWEVELLDDAFDVS